MRRALLFLAVPLFGFVSAAAEPEPPQIDAAMRAAGFGEVPGAGNWLSRTTVDPMDDSKLMLVFVKSESGQMLAISCSNKPGDEVRFSVGWNEIIGEAGKPVLAWIRIGSRKKEPSIPWIVANTSQAMYLSNATDKAPTSDRTTRLLASLAGESKLAFEVWLPEPPLATTTAVFDIRGVESALSVLRPNCPWAWQRETAPGP